MKPVNKDQFFARIGPLDVHPSHANPNFTEWKNRAGQVIGRSLPGWRNAYTDGKLTPAEYFLA
jgi:hypothetical protein